MYPCHTRTKLQKDRLLEKRHKKKVPWSPIRIQLHSTYWLNEVICSHLNDSISVKHGTSLVMENKWVSCPVKTALSTGRNMKWRQALLLLSLFSFATSACSHISIVEAFRCIVYPAATSKFPKETRDIHRCLRFTFINGPRLLKQQRAIRTTQSDTPPLVTSVKSHLNSWGGSVSLSQKLSFTNTNRCSLCDPVSIY